MDKYDEVKVEISALEVADIIAEILGFDPHVWIRQKQEASVLPDGKTITWVFLTYRKSERKDATENKE